VQHGNFNFLRLSEMEPPLVSLSLLAGKQLKGRCQFPAVLKAGDVWKRFFLLQYKNRCLSAVLSRIEKIWICKMIF